MKRAILAVIFSFAYTGAIYATDITSYDPMMRGDTAATSNGWSVLPVFTVGEKIDGYQPPGILDGVGAFRLKKDDTIRVLVNHEFDPDDGYAYTLANGTSLTGARVSYIDLDREDFDIEGAGLAFKKVYDRHGKIVTDPEQINETGNGADGFARFCSARGVSAGQYGFVDNIFFTGEETSKPFHPHGGTEWALDVKKKEIWAVPDMGRAAWENVTPLDTGTNDKTALLGGDDVEGAPLYLYIGEKSKNRGAGFLERNGLKEGKLYCWRADNGDLDPNAFNGFNQSRTGTFVPMDVKDPSMAGQAGYDGQGYLDGDTMRAQADNLGCFSFSRPEDLHEDPYNPSRAAFASTGRGQLYTSDNWGTLYIVDVDFSDMNNKITADLTILHDADDLPVPDQGVRSPDNLTWSPDGFIYIQEDRSTSPSTLFGGVKGVEASLWKISPSTGDYARIGEIDRSAVAPNGSTDPSPDDIGNWESSGILDVSDLFKTYRNETLLIGTVQAHSIRDGVIEENNLVQGGQLVILSNKSEFLQSEPKDKDRKREKEAKRSKYGKDD